ncbi:hypothetical protein SDJN02_07693, partial [Cucurbita argyrosperma subsp. argyrosperma]
MTNLVKFCAPTGTAQPVSSQNPYAELAIKAFPPLSNLLRPLVLSLSLSMILYLGNKFCVHIAGLRIHFAGSLAFLDYNFKFGFAVGLHDCDLHASTVNAV